MTDNTTREELIQLCTDGVVPVDQWANRDTAGAQEQLGSALALLRAGCEYQTAGDPADTANTHWIRISYPGFSAFEYGRDDRINWTSDLYYIPTRTRLDNANGSDWY